MWWYLNVTLIFISISIMNIFQYAYFLAINLFMQNICSSDLIFIGLLGRIVFIVVEFFGFVFGPCLVVFRTTSWFFAQKSLLVAVFKSLLVAVFKSRSLTGSHIQGKCLKHYIIIQDLDIKNPYYFRYVEHKTFMWNIM